MNPVFVMFQYIKIILIFYMAEHTRGNKASRLF